MNILVGNIPLPNNRFLVDLNGGLEQLGVTVKHSHEQFWNAEGDFDVLHLHFPEYMTFEIEAAYRNTLTEDLLAKTEERLRHWANRAAIVVTRHVLLPHDAVSNPVWERMYELVYRYADGVVHFANASVEEFRERYAHAAFHRGRPPSHAVIPHHNYESLPNECDRDEARRHLRIAGDRSVMLVFGAIRNLDERELILRAFNGARAPHKLLLVSRWRERLAEVQWVRLKYWLRDAKRLYHRLHPRHAFNYAFVEEEDAQYYLNAADILFIPRFHVLNSGNVTMGMTFGRVVVGPDSWDVGELLRETGNPVFDPDRPETAATAVDQGFELAKNGHGARNRERALKHWTVARCASQYRDFLTKIHTEKQTS